MEKNVTNRIRKAISEIDKTVDLSLKANDARFVKELVEVKNLLEWIETGTRPINSGWVSYLNL